MSAVVYDLADYAVRRKRSTAAYTHYARSTLTAVERCGTTSSSQNSDLDFCFWQGASGKRYVHHVFSLIECPQVPQATYVLVGRDPHGNGVALHIGSVEDDAQSLNLADIRHRGATLGAKEVHIHLLGRDFNERAEIADDIRDGLSAGATAMPLGA